MGMDDTDFAIASMLSKCKTSDDLQKLIIFQAIILQQLICKMASDIDQSEAGIRALYDALADMAVTEFIDPQGIARRKPH